MPGCQLGLPFFALCACNLRMQSSPAADLIAQACLTAYNKLPPKGKPRIRKDGVREWTVLAGLLLLDSETDHVEVISLG
jgi:hypothetical protein